MISDSSGIKRWICHGIILCQINLVALPLSATQSHEQLTPDRWIPASSSNLPDRFCKLSSHSIEHTPCTIEISDDFSPTPMRLGTGFLTPESEADGAPQVCQISLPTALFASRRDITATLSKLENLAGQDSNRWMNLSFSCMRNNTDPTSTEQCSSEGNYQMIAIKSPHFHLLHCNEDHELSLDSDSAYDFFYNGANPELPPPTDLDANTVSNLAQLVASLFFPGQFFRTENATENSYCDNLCPSGFEATESTGFSRRGACNRNNNATQPFFDRANYDYTFNCAPCPGNETYRSGTPLERLRHSPGYQFKCQYECRELTRCDAPFVNPGDHDPRFADSRYFDRVCDCSASDVRVVLQSPQRVQCDIVTDPVDKFRCLEGSESKGRYYGYQDERGATKNFELFCMKRLRFCLGISGGVLQFGTTHSSDPGYCYIPGPQNSYTKSANPIFQDIYLTGHVSVQETEEPQTTTDNSTTGISTTTIIISGTVVAVTLIGVSAVILGMYALYKYRRHHRSSPVHFYEAPRPRLHTNPIYDQGSSWPTLGGSDNKLNAAYEATTKALSDSDSHIYSTIPSRTNSAASLPRQVHDATSTVSQQLRRANPMSKTPSARNSAILSVYYPTVDNVLPGDSSDHQLYLPGLGSPELSPANSQYEVMMPPAGN